MGDTVNFTDAEYDMMYKIYNSISSKDGISKQDWMKAMHMMNKYLQKMIPADAIKAWKAGMKWKKMAKGVTQKEIDSFKPLARMIAKKARKFKRGTGIFKHVEKMKYGGWNFSKIMREMHEFFKKGGVFDQYDKDNNHMINFPEMK